MFFVFFLYNVSKELQLNKTNCQKNKKTKKKKKKKKHCHSLQKIGYNMVVLRQTSEWLLTQIWLIILCPFFDDGGLVLRLND